MICRSDQKQAPTGGAINASRRLTPPESVMRNSRAVYLCIATLPGGKRKAYPLAHCRRGTGAHWARQRKIALHLRDEKRGA